MEAPEQTVVPPQESFESNLSTEEITELNQLFTSKSEESGIKTHYPTYIPEGIEFNKENIIVSQTETIGNVLTYSIGGELDSDLPWIMVQEQAENPDSGEHIPGPNETKIPNLNGYGVTSKNEAGTFNHVIFTTEDGTFVKITSKYFDLTTLSKIAKSMK